MSVSKKAQQSSIEGWLLPLEPGELSVFKCSPSYHYRMSAADKEKHRTLLNITSVAQVKATLCRPIKTKPPTTATPKRLYKPRKKLQAAPGVAPAVAPAVAKSAARNGKTSKIKNRFPSTTRGHFFSIVSVASVPSLPESVPINKEKSVEELTNVPDQLECQEVSCEDAGLRRSPNMQANANDDRAAAGMELVQPTERSEAVCEAATDIVNKLKEEVDEEGLAVPTWAVCSDGKNCQPPDNASDIEAAEPNYDLLLRELKEELFLLLSDSKWP